MYLGGQSDTYLNKIKARVSSGNTDAGIHGMWTPESLIRPVTLILFNANSYFGHINVAQVSATITGLHYNFIFMLCFLREFVVVPRLKQMQLLFYFLTEDEQNKFLGEAYNCAHVEE